METDTKTNTHTDRGYARGKGLRRAAPEFLPVPQPPAVAPRAKAFGEDVGKC